jgi:hypothetical protein
LHVCIGGDCIIAAHSGGAKDAIVFPGPQTPPSSEAESGPSSAANSAGVWYTPTDSHKHWYIKRGHAKIDLLNRTLAVGQAKTEADSGRGIPLNSLVRAGLVRWAGEICIERLQ